VTDSDTARYRGWELSKVLGDDELRIKITGDVDQHGLDGARWLSITRQELDQITAILTEGK
jgi:hypothetical protein